jgi:superfamily II DNA/RNA helicase
LFFFNFDFYCLLRVGRTARAGRDGNAITLTTQIDVIEYQKIEECIGKKNEEYNLVESEVMNLAARVAEAQKETLFVRVEHFLKVSIDFKF